MFTLDRRQFLAASAGLVAGAGALSAHEGIHSIFQGVQIGAQSYSFRDRPIEEAVAAMKQIGLGECEMWSGHMERMPGKRPSREELRDWRLNVDLGKFEQVHELFHEAGVDLYAFNYSFRDDFTDPEIERGFRDGQGARRESDHGLGERLCRQACRQGRAKAQDARRNAQPLAHPR
ncbi:MAG: hypothetical protein R2748_13350 [Bryobacterales bacterium]